MSAATQQGGAGGGVSRERMADLLFDDMERELTSTRRVLERFPDDKLDWRPHAKSRPLAELATHVADLPGRGVGMLTTPELDVAGRAPAAPAKTRAELLERFDKGANALRQALASADDAAFGETWTMRAGPQVLMQAKRRNALRTVLVSHMVHHRAQLGVYLRLLEIPVPGVYGPSADE